MLGKPNHWTAKKLRDHGVRATAVVLEIAHNGMSITTGNLVADTEVMLKTRLRVEPAGQPAFEVEKRFRYGQFSVPRPGSHVPVIFDPDDHDKIMLDDSPQAFLHAHLAESDLPPERIAAIEQIGQAAMSGASRDEIRAQIRAIKQNMPAGQGVVFAPMAAGAAQADPLDELAKLADLKERGVLTDAEFQAQKKRILGEP